MRWAAVALAVLALAAPAAARAQGLGLERVTTGPSGGNADVPTGMLATSADGTRALFVSDEALTPDDDRPGYDYYERVGGTTRLLAQDAGQQPRFSGYFYGASADATRIVIAGFNHWTTGDVDDSEDVYSIKDRVIEWVSHGPLGGNAATFGAEPAAMSGDGARVVFETAENLTADDTDYKTRDVYLREGGVTTRLSTGPKGGNQNGGDADVVGQSDDARRIVIRTPEPLTPDDTDAQLDLYVRGGGQTVKVSPGNGAFEARAAGVSSDGGTVVFTTQERLTPDDTDTRADAYRWAGGSLVKVSPGNSPDHQVGDEPNEIGGQVLFMSDDGTRVVFNTEERLTADDTDDMSDSYLWTPAGVQKVTPGNGEYYPGGWELSATVVGGSPDASHLVFATGERLTADDTDLRVDLYEWAGGTVRRVTTGPTHDDSNAEHIYCLPFYGYCGSLRFVSQDGSRIVFETDEGLVPADTDDDIDVYQRAGGVTTLLSPARPDRQPVYGERDKDVRFIDASLDGSIAYLESEEQLTADDTNLRPDGVRVRPPAPGTVVDGVSGPGPGGAAGGPAAGAPAATPGGGSPPASTPARSAARLRLAGRPRSLRLVRGKTRLARRGRGRELRLTRTKALRVGAERLVGGRRDGATCRAPTVRLRSAPRCTRIVAAARPKRLRTTGTRAVLRLGRRSLKAGRHRITLTPLDAAGRTGTPVRVTLKLRR